MAGRKRFAGRLSIRASAWSVVSATLALGACERVVDIDLEESEKRLVVEGRVELIKEAPSGDQVIRLRTTDAFFSNAPTPPATGATVTVTDGSGGVFGYVETEPGVYRATGLLPSIGETYTLDIRYQGDDYRATAQLLAVSAIDSLYFIFEEENIIIEEEGFRATIDYSDPAGIVNYYLWEQFVDGVNILPPDPGNAFNLVSSDEFYDGQTVTAYQPNDEVAIQTGQVVEVRQVSLSQSAHDYYYALFEQNALGSGNPFSIPPANIQGNVQNLTRPDRRALGLFEAAEVSRRFATAPSQGGTP